MQIQLKVLPSSDGYIVVLIGTESHYDEDWEEYHDTETFRREEHISGADEIAEVATELLRGLIDTDHCAIGQLEIKVEFKPPDSGSNR